MCSIFKIFCTYICWIIYKMQHLEVSGVVRHIYIYMYVVRQLRVNTQLKFSKNFIIIVINLVPNLYYCHYCSSNYWMPSIFCAFHNHNINKNKMNNLQVLSFNKKMAANRNPDTKKLYASKRKQIRIKNVYWYAPKIVCWWLSSDIQNFVVVCNMRYILLHIIHNLHFSFANKWAWKDTKNYGE